VDRIQLPGSCEGLANLCRSAHCELSLSTL
jgi:hypothetical protein